MRFPTIHNQKVTIARMFPVFMSDNDKNENAQNVKENKYCKFHIPSSPGKHRLTEECNSLSTLQSNNNTKKEILNEKLDMLSLGHVHLHNVNRIVYYANIGKMILTKNIIKHSISNGVTLLKYTRKEKHASTKSDDVLWSIIERAHLIDVDRRVSSIEVVDILENHLSTLTHNSNEHKLCIFH